MVLKIATFIPMLDSVLDGGVSKNKSILFMATPGVDNSVFAYQMLYSGLKKGDHGIYLINNKRSEIVKTQLEEYDFDVGNFEQKGLVGFLDCYSAMIGSQSNEHFFVQNSNNLEEIDAKIIEAMKFMKNQNTLLVFDALSTFIDSFGDDGLKYIKKWLQESEKYNVVPVFLFTQWHYNKKTLDRIKELFDCIVELRAVEQKVFLRYYFRVIKASWLRKFESKGIPFKIMKPGGIYVYIPKILVTGPFNAGKTSFVHSASVKAVSVDRLSTTVALDYGHVKHRGFAVDLFGTPGQERFDPILEILGSESLGVVIVVDSTDPSGFERAKDMIKLSNTEGLPAVIVANKANLKGALKPEQIRKKMKLPKEIPIITMVAENMKNVKKGEPCTLKKENVSEVLDKLFGMVI